MREGDEVVAEVTTIEENGIYLVYDGVPGFVNVTHLTWNQRGGHKPEDFAKVGDLLRVRVYGCTPERFYASLKELRPEDNPWQDPNVFAVGSIHNGEVYSIARFGAFVELDNGAVGLVRDDDKERKLGERLALRVVSFDPDLKKVELEVA